MGKEFDVYDKRNSAILILVISVVLAGMTNLFWLVFIGFVFSAWIFTTIKCPNCKHSLIFHPKGYATPFIPDECWNCHYKLRQK